MAAELERLRRELASDVAKERRQREKIKRRKRRYSGDDDDFEESENVMPKWKMFMVGACILVCFVLIYPTVFSPILNNILGRTAPSHPPPASPRAGHPSMAGRAPHPAAAASMRMPPMAEQASQPSSGRGGMFSWMLPIYTIGVVGFLFYTLFKPKENKRRRRGGFYDEFSSEESDGGTQMTMGRRKMRVVQERLQKTEAAMRQILEQLEGLACQANAAQPPTQPSPAESAGEVNQQQLSPEQVQEMEQGLRDLKALSDLCQQQRAELASSDEEEIDYGGDEIDEQVNRTEDYNERPMGEEDMFEDDESETEGEEGEEQTVESEEERLTEVDLAEMTIKEKQNPVRKRIRRQD